MTGGCWYWTGGTTADGYGRFRVTVSPGRYRLIRAHRWAYTDARGPIPDGLTLDHLCRTRACVRPDHLEAVPAAENRRRAAAHRQLTDPSKET